MLFFRFFTRVRLFYNLNSINAAVATTKIGVFPIQTGGGVAILWEIFYVIIYYSGVG